MKKCKYCQSEIDVNAKICPFCRRNLNKSNLALILSLSIGLPIIAIVIIGIIISNGFKSAELSKFKNKAREYISNAQYQYTEELFENNGETIDYRCYYIDDNEYIGSVKVEYDDGEYEYEIWLSNGNYYASGEQDDISVVKSNKTATTNCHRY